MILLVRSFVGPRASQWKNKFRVKNTVNKRYPAKAMGNLYRLVGMLISIMGCQDKHNVYCRQDDKMPPALWPAAPVRGVTILLDPTRRQHIICIWAQRKKTGRIRCQCPGRAGKIIVCIEDHRPSGGNLHGRSPVIRHTFGCQL